MTFKMKRICYILALAAMSASAQNLSTEITVDRTIVPAERAAMRLNSVRPALLSTPVAPSRIGMTEYTEPGTVTRSSVVLAPAAWADTFAVSPYRGYVSGGYFPAYNLAVSAGYRLLQTADTRLGVWGQFDGLSYKHRPAPDAEKNTYKYNINAYGADFDHRFGSHGVLTVGAAYRFGSVQAPHEEYYDRRNINMADVRAAWYARAGRAGYHVDAELHTFGYKPKLNDGVVFDGPAPEGLYGTKGTELNFAASAGVIARLGERRAGHRAGLELKADMLSRPDALVLERGIYTLTGDEYFCPALAKGSTLGVISATPYYAFGGATGLNLRLGARIDISTGGDGKKFHIAPDVQASYSRSGFSIYARAGGGEVLNTQRTLSDFTPFFPVGWMYGRSHVPLTVDAGVNVGPFAGFGIGVFGGWARANDWLMPSLTSIYFSPVATMQPVDVKGFHAGIRAVYDYRSLLHVEASAEFAPQSATSGYYLWRDRAKSVVKASATVRPLERLELTLGYEFREGRACYTLYPVEGAERVGLGCVSDLSFGARYALTSALDIFARGDNLLGRRYSVLPGIASQGVHGLVGASFKF